MKYLLPFIVFALSYFPVNAKEPSLKREQVTKIAEIILKSESYKKLRESYVPKKATYDEKTGDWSIQVSDSAMAVFPGSPISFFYIRDRDRKYRIGSVSGSGYSPTSSKNYRMSPLLRKKITTVK